MNTAQRHTRIRPSLSLLVICLISLSVALLAQSYRGSIRGTVRDASGAVVPGANITAKNVATGETRAAVSGSDGGYVIAEVPSGQYEVSASSASLATVTSQVLVAEEVSDMAAATMTAVCGLASPRP